VTTLLQSAPARPSSTEHHNAIERTILGVRFFVGSSEEAARRGLEGGLVVVPAAPALAEIVRDREFREAARCADLVLTDSGFMVLVWWILTREWLPRTSGLRYLRLLLAAPQMRAQSSPVWIMPSLAAARRCMRWLQRHGHQASFDSFYIAPYYPPGPVHDPGLLAFVRERRPSHVFLGLGGGTQEKVGLYLKRHLDHRPGIHCIGAAIGFLTGEQVRIPDWADRLLLGWLLRCADRPTRFVPRYWRSRKLGWLMWRYRERSPVN
jgi:UDP-N-acetyl-D-mannosaminuronic acid transferase (WecB/TagA/CpsF family)